MMKVIFWGSIGLVGAAYFLYPIAIFLLAKMSRRELFIQYIMPSISLIIPMHNEERVVREKIENILSLDYPKDKMEIIFALDCCTDKTKELLLSLKDDRMKILDNTERNGKVSALNSAVRKANGEIIVFSDANSMHKRDAIKRLVRNFADKDVACVAGKLVYSETEATSVGKGENLYWKYEDFLKRQESKLGRLLVTNGSIQAVRKDKYPYPDPTIADDFSIPILIQANGGKVLYEPEAIVYERATQSSKEEYAQKVRIISQGIKGAIKLRRDILRLDPIGIFQILFHKIIRWCVPFLLIAIFVSSIALVGNAFYFYMLLAQVAFYALALVGLVLRNNSRIKIFYIPFYLCLINFASLAAFFRVAKRGDTHVWDKAHSTRLVNT